MTFIKFIILIIAALLSAMSAIAIADELNCVLCHKYKGLSRVDDKGQFKLYYISEQLFESSPHSKNSCLDCHQGIKEVPHKNVKEVDCSTECHMTEPSSDTKFSHDIIKENLQQSVHNKYDSKGKLKEYPEDYPGCKDCHDQPLYRPLHKDISSKERDVARCKSCHASGDFAEELYNHMTTRLHKFRSPKENISVCAKCHGDKKFNQRHKLDDVVSSYKETFHAKLIQLGSEKAPDCIDCHVVRGENAHLIEAKKVNTSATHESNISRTCRGASCHDKASENIAGFKTHVTYERSKYPLQFYMLTFFRIVLTVVLYAFLLIVFMELLRRLFPHITIPDMLSRLRKGKDK